MMRILIVAATAIALSACAYGDATLKLAYDADSAKSGVLSEAASATVNVKDVDDARVEKNAIGYKRNGFGAKTADILSERPAPELVKETLVATLEKNGHKVDDAENRFAIKTKLNNFWFDYKTGLVSVEFYGSIQAEISVIDQQSGETVYTELFDGYHSEKTGGGLAKTWTRIMNAALADLVNKVNLSPGFKDALAAVAAAQAAPALSSLDPAAAGS
jgi:uncharacterized lipoprotein YajG